MSDARFLLTVPISFSSLNCSLSSFFRKPAMLKYYLQTLLDMVNNLYQYKEANKSIDILNEDHKEEVDTLKMKIDELKKLLDNQQDVLNRRFLLTVPISFSSLNCSLSSFFRSSFFISIF